MSHQQVLLVPGSGHTCQHMPAAAHLMRHTGHHTHREGHFYRTTRASEWAHSTPGWSHSALRAGSSTQPVVFHSGKTPSVSLVHGLTGTCTCGAVLVVTVTVVVQYSTAQYSKGVGNSSILGASLPIYPSLSGLILDVQKQKSEHQQRQQHQPKVLPYLPLVEVVCHAHAGICLHQLSRKVGGQLHVLGAQAHLQHRTYPMHGHTAHFKVSQTTVLQGRKYGSMEGCRADCMLGGSFSSTRLRSLTTLLRYV